MGEPLHVLVYGSIDDGPCDSIRLGGYRELLRTHDVDLRTWGEFNGYSVTTPIAYAGRLDDAVRDGVAKADLSPIEWADVLVFRRWYCTVHTCADCDFAGPDAASVVEHVRTEGHLAATPDRAIRLVLAAIENDPAILRGRALVYEMDDNLLAVSPWLGFYRRMQGDTDLVPRLLRRADLVTVTTPALASAMSLYNPAVRVIRNAVLPDRYRADDHETGDRPLSFLYYGVRVRSRDYAICRDAVDASAKAFGARRIWLGCNDADIAEIVDEAHPYVANLAEFARQLVSARPAIGLAPVSQDEFSRGHSELHWLEYSLAGAATVATRTMGAGPYDVIRDGVDGLLARNKAQWRSQLSRLAGSRTLREELAGRARERVLAEYDVRDRVVEWAEAFRWAADHAGRGAMRRGDSGLARAGRVRSDAEMVAEARANLAHRQRSRSRATEECDNLALLRNGHDVCWPEESAPDPVVSVVMPVCDGSRRSLELTLGSVLGQTYRNIEVLLVAGTQASQALEGVRAIDDPRLRIVDPLEPAPDSRLFDSSTWSMQRSRLFNRGLDLARGAWITPLAFAGELTPDHVEVLLSVALENRLEFVYGDSWAQRPMDTWARVGSWPPRQDGHRLGAAMYAAPLRFFRMDEESWREGEPADWNLVRRMLGAGVRAGHVDRIVFRDHTEAPDRPGLSEAS